MPASKARSRGGGGKRGPKPCPKAREAIEEYPSLGSPPCGDQAGGGEQALHLYVSGQEEASRVSRTDRASVFVVSDHGSRRRLPGPADLFLLKRPDQTLRPCLEDERQTGPISDKRSLLNPILKLGMSVFVVSDHGSRRRLPGPADLFLLKRPDQTLRPCLEDARQTGPISDKRSLLNPILKLGMDLVPELGELGTVTEDVEWCILHSALPPAIGWACAIALLYPEAHLIPKSVLTLNGTVPGIFGSGRPEAELCKDLISHLCELSKKPPFKKH
ncbi:hypothetical protein NDU88_006818 [Pleurodeles waltl]|uniref:Uncharacterized protein n=1 Tax=Pleurodeles waltl TaxID=8319 RepID=A0AAV7X529_PLEWA|nr:hypothetical protein NDU88_006818 [Pleurodeles waltl]